MPRYLEYPFPIQAQDDRRSWLCIFGVSLVFIFNVALIPTFRLLFDPIFAEDNLGATVVMNLFQFISNLTILATGFLLKNLSAKNFVLLGSSVTFVGMLMCSIVTSAMPLIFTFSVTIGIGLGLLNPAAFTAVLSCFTSRVNVAISIGFASLGIGQLLMPKLVKLLMLTLGQQPTLFIMSGVSLFGLVGGIFLAPIRWVPAARRNSEYQPLIIKKSFEKSTLFKSIVYATDLDLIWNVNYITIIFGLSVLYATSANANIVLPIYLQRNTNLDVSQIEYCMLTISVSDIVSRLCYPLIVHVSRISNRTAFLVGVAGLAVVRLIFVTANIQDYNFVLYVCAAFGFFRGMTVVNHVLVIVDYCETNCPTKLPGTLGMSVVIKASMLVLFNWTFNGMKDFSPDLTMPFYVQICLFACVIFLWVIDR